MWCIILTRKAFPLTPVCLFVFFQIWTTVWRRGPFPKENSSLVKGIVLIHALHWKFQYRFFISVVRTQTSSPMAACIPPGSNYNPISEQLAGKSSGKKLSALSNSMKLWAVLCRPTQDGCVMVESYDKFWSSGEGNGKLLKYSCLENPMNNMKRQTDRTLKDEHPRSVGDKHATGDQSRNNSRKNKEMEPKQKQHPVVDVTGDGNKVRCYKEQYCIGTWNVRLMNQGKLEVVK